MSTAKLLFASSEQCADLYWATGFYVPDPILFLEHKGKKILLASDLEVSRAKKEADVDVVLSHSEYDAKVKKTGKKRREGDIINAVLRERRIKKLQVPSYFPIKHALMLKKWGYEL